ncbi:MAG: hypothetical protein ACXWPS_13525 [Ktedonobacteraceae bacterium]
MSHRHAFHIQRRQAQRQQRLESACWFLVIWGVRLQRWSHPSAAVATATTAQTLQKYPTPRSGSAYSWHKPFLRRPPSPSEATAELRAK